MLNVTFEVADVDVYIPVDYFLDWRNTSLHFPSYLCSPWGLIPIEVSR